MPIVLKSAVKIAHRPLRKLLAHLPKLASTEASAIQELTEVQRIFRESAASEKARKEATTNAAHYIVLTFGTAERATAFAAAKGWSVDCHTLVDGEKVAVKEGIVLPPISGISKKKNPTMKSISRIDARGGE